MGFGYQIGGTVRVPGRGFRRLLTVLVVLVLAAGTGIGVAINSPALMTQLGLPVIGAPLDPPPVRPNAALTGLPSNAPVPTNGGIAAVLDPIAGGSGGRLTGMVIDAETGRELWSRDPQRALVPASTLKLLTGAAALLELRRVDRLITRVVAGPTPDSVVLVGGGDPTLSVLPAGRSSVYPNAPRLDALAEAVKTARQGQVRTVLVDVGRYTGLAMAPGWLPSDVPGGFVAPIVPLMVDGGRADPTAQDGSRVALPAQTAGRALAQRLGADPNSVAVGTAPAGAPVLGEVASAPISELVEQMLRSSDNVLAEVLAREVAIARKAEPSFAGASKGVLDALTNIGMDASGVVTVDGSGLSVQNQVPARLLAQILAASSGSGESPKTGALRGLLGGLPVAGGEGTLDDRFGAGPSLAGRGFIRAKTGTLTNVTSLAGVVPTAQGRLLVFALLSNGASALGVRLRMDAMATALHGCGCS